MVSSFRFQTRCFLIFEILFNIIFNNYAQETAQQIVDKARDQRNQQTPLEAYQTLLQLRSNQQTTESLQLKAGLEMQMGKTHDAIYSLTEIIILDKFYLEAYFQRGKLYLDLNLYQEADHDFTYIIDNQNQDTRSILFQISETGDEQVKIKTIRQMIPEVYAYRAAAREKLGQIYKAKLDHNQAVGMDSISDRLIDRALFYSRQNEKDNSILDLQAAINLDFNSAKAWYNLLIILPETELPSHIVFEEFRPLLEFKVVEAIIEGDGITAENLLNNLIIMCPDDDELLVLQGRVAYLKKEYQRAEQFYLSAISEIPQLSETHLLLGNLYFQTKEYQKAIDAYRMYLILEPYEGKAYYNLANANFALKNNVAACEYLSHAFALGFEVNSQLRKKCLKINEGF